MLCSQLVGWENLVLLLKGKVTVAREDNVSVDQSVTPGDRIVIYHSRLAEEVLDSEIKRLGRTHHFADVGVVKRSFIRTATNPLLSLRHA